MSKAYTVIVGAGVAGLTAAGMLQDQGRQVVLLEAADQVGGLCRSYTLDSVVFDLGPHLFLANPAIESHRFILDLLKPEPVVRNPFHFAIQARGRYWIMPLNLPDIALHYPWAYKKEAILAHLGRGGAGSADSRSVRAMMEAKSGPSFYRDVFGPFIARKTGMPGSDLHRDWSERVDRDVRNRKVPFSGLTERVSLGDKLKATFFPQYHYPLRGFGAIAERLWRRFSEAGGRTVLSCGALSLEVRDGRVAEVRCGEESFAVESLVWTASINELNRLLGGPARKLHFRDNYIVLLTYGRQGRPRRPFAYTYHTDPGLVFNRLYYADNLLGGQAPAECEGLCAEILAEEGPAPRDDRALVEAACAGVEALGLHPRGRLRQSMVLHLADCMPVYGLDYEERMREAFTRVHGIANLFSVGRRGGYFFCQTPSAVEQGMKMARHLLGAGES